MIQKIIHRLKSEEGRDYTFFSNGICIVSFMCTHYDAEIDELRYIKQNIETNLESLSPDISIRFSSLIDFDYGSPKLGVSRDTSIGEIGRTNSKLIISFEKKFPTLGKFMSSFIKREKNSYYDFVNEFDKEIKDNFLSCFTNKYENFPYQVPFNSVPKQSKSGVKIGNTYYSVLKLHKASSHEINMSMLTELRDELPSPAIISTSIKRMSETKKQSTVNTTYEREKTGKDASSYEKFMAAEKLKRDIELKGENLFYVEMSIVLSSKSEESLVDSSYSVRNKLKLLGDFGVETVGCYPSLASALPGGKSHYNVYEKINDVPSYLPILTRGNNNLEKVTKSTFLYHRTDGSIDGLDLFDRGYPNYNAIVSGKSGLGKSVFINSIIDSFYHDSDTKISIIDVMGSYTKMVEEKGGHITRLGAETKAIMSPFQKVRPESIDSETRELITDWVEKLLLEKDEKYLSNAEQLKLDNLVKGYFETKKKSYSLNDFAKYASEIPRKDSFRRWLKGGNYEYVFTDYKSDNASQPRLIYTDFKNIASAQKTGLNQAIMNCSLTNLYLDLITKKRGEKWLFIIDEAPTIKDNWFKGLCIFMRNFRKTYSSLLLGTQDLEGLTVVNESGQRDKTLINQATTKIFFSEDEGSKSFQDDSRLSDRGLGLLRSFVPDKGKKSQFLLKDVYGERAGFLYLSKKEYYRATTESYDEAKIEAVKNALGLSSMFKAAEVLGMVEGAQ